jgi:hypothetical protein
MVWFAGALQPSDEHVAESSYCQYDLYPINFYTFGGALVFNFYLLALNHWPILMNGVEASAESASRLYFVAFWIVHVVVLLNVIVAFVVDAFGIQKDKRAAAASAASGNASASQTVEDWTGLLRASGVDFSSYRISRVLEHGDVQDDVYCAELRERFADTFTTAVPRPASAPAATAGAESRKRP